MHPPCHRGRPLSAAPILQNVLKLGGSACFASGTAQAFCRIHSRPRPWALAAVPANRSVLPAAGGFSISPTTRQERTRKITRGRGLALITQPTAGRYANGLLDDRRATVLAQTYSASTWYRYTPDSTGGYSDGTWAQVATLPAGYGPTAFASAVLADGRLAISGGEYNTPGQFDLQLTNLGAVYDPVANKWTAIGHPRGWGWIGDSPASVLPDGRFLVGQKLTKQDAVLDPKTLHWTKLGDAGKSDFNAEEGYTLLPDGTILTADVKNAPNSERYNATTGQWKSAGSTIVDLHSPTDGSGLFDLRPQAERLLLPAGRNRAADAATRWNGIRDRFVFRRERTRHRTYCHLPSIWKRRQLDGRSGLSQRRQRRRLVRRTLAQRQRAGVRRERRAVRVQRHVFYLRGRRLGHTAPAAHGTSAHPRVLTVGLYTPSGQPQASWLPKIGREGNEDREPRKNLSDLGDAVQRFVASDVVWRRVPKRDQLPAGANHEQVRPVTCSTRRTHDHSSMGVATGSLIVSTNFDVPSSMENRREHVASRSERGLASTAIAVTVKGKTRSSTSWSQRGRRRSS